MVLSFVPSGFVPSGPGVADPNLVLTHRDEADLLAEDAAHLDRHDPDRAKLRAVIGARAALWAGVAFADVAAAFGSDVARIAQAEPAAAATLV
jgi:hypothetical protein